MATQKQGTIVHWESLSPILAIVRLAPENGSRFPSYVPGQYMALRRENCRLTRRTTDRGRQRQLRPGPRRKRSAPLRVRHSLLFHYFFSL